LPTEDLKPGEAKEIAKSLWELSKCGKEFGTAFGAVTHESKSLKRLVGGNEEAKARDSWLIKAGVALVLFPDPTITDLIGGCLIAAGMLKNRNKQLTAAEVYKEFHETMRKIVKNGRGLTSF